MLLEWTTCTWNTCTIVCLPQVAQIHITSKFLQGLIYVSTSHILIGHRPEVYTLFLVSSTIQSLWRVITVVISIIIWSRSFLVVDTTSEYEAGQELLLTVSMIVWLMQVCVLSTILYRRNYCTQSRYAPDLPLLLFLCLSFLHEHASIL